MELGTPEKEALMHCHLDPKEEDIPWQQISPLPAPLYLWQSSPEPF